MYIMKIKIYDYMLRFNEIISKAKTSKAVWNYPFT